MKNLVTIIGILFTGLIANAQTTVKIIDFSIIPVASIAQETPSDSLTIMVQFKINKAEDAATAHLYMDTSQGQSNILDLELPFVTQAGKHYLVYNGEQYEVKSYNVNVPVKVSTQVYNSFSNATLFIETKMGANTLNLYYQK